VPRTTLDALIARFALPRFVKIDVQSLEAEVLQRLIRPILPLSFEFTTIQRQSALQALTAWEWLGGYGYNVALDESGTLVHQRSLDAASIGDWGVDVDASTPLLWVLREQPRLTGTKHRCGIGAAGPARCTSTVRRFDGDVSLDLCVRSMSGDTPASVVVGHLDVINIAIFPVETDAPLVVDANAPMTFAVSAKLLQAIRRRHAEEGFRPEQQLPAGTLSR
jgi:hypothetical protein